MGTLFPLSCTFLFLPKSQIDLFKFDWCVGLLVFWIVKQVVWISCWDDDCMFFTIICLTWFTRARRLLFTASHILLLVLLTFTAWNYRVARLATSSTAIPTYPNGLGEWNWLCVILIVTSSVTAAISARWAFTCCFMGRWLVCHTQMLVLPVLSLLVRRWALFCHCCPSLI